jgi:hypothetical protein
MYLSWFDRYHFYAVLDDVDDDLSRQIRQRVGAGGVPITPIGIANWAGYSLGHRGRRLREAIELSKWIALRNLKAKLGGIKLDDVWPLLLEICHDLALYIGGSAVAGGLLGAAVGSMGLGIGAVPGALAGTAAGVQIGQMLLGFIGLKSVIEYMLDQLPVAIDEYRKGFLVAWGPMPSSRDMFSETPASRYNFESNAMAAGNFARGHEIIIIALLMAIVTYLGKGKGNLKALMAEASSHSKLGPKFATWLEQNERELSASPVLQVRPKGGGQTGSPKEAIGPAPRQPKSEATKAEDATAKGGPSASQHATGSVNSANGGQKTVRLTFDKGTQTWRTPAGVDYGPGSIHGNRVKHVLDHAEPNPAKKAHTVFNVGRARVLGLVDEAWRAKGNPLPNDPGAYIVQMGRVIGTAGETSIKIIVRPGTSKIITAYPFK